MVTTMNRIIKSVAAAMALSLTLPVFLSGCFKKDSGKDDNSWYEAKTIDLPLQYDKSEYEELDTYFIGLVKDKAVVRVDYFKPLPAGFDYSNDDITLYQGSSLEIYDTDGKFIKSYNCKEIKEQKGLQNGSFGSFLISSDSVILPFSVYSESGADATEIMYFDIDSGKVTDSFRTEPTGKYLYSSVFAGDYCVFAYADYEAQEALELKIYDKDRNVKTIELNSAGISWNAALPLINIGKDRVAAPYTNVKSGDWQNVGYYVVDLKNASAKQEDDGISWAGGYDRFWNISGVEGLGPCSSDDDGFFTADFDSKKTEQVINYDRCDVNLYLIRHMKPYRAENGRYIFGGCVLEEDHLKTNTPARLIILQKSDKDLLQGKTELKLASFSVADYSTSQAVLNFNLTNSEYRISFDTRYNLSNFVENSTTDDMATIELKARKKLLDKLKVDISAGEGPDIIMNGMDYTASLDEVLFADLTNDISSDGLFGNIIDACKTNGKLYSVPLTFQLSGICTDSKYVNDGQKGFTFEEYEKFVSKVCNGKDPVEMKKLDYFAYNFSLMYNRFLDSSGNPDFDSSGFVALARYVKENVTYTEPDPEDIPAMETIDDKTHAVYKTISSVKDYAGCFDHKTYKTVILGTPSVDASGPAVSVIYSAGVSSSSANKAGAVEFIKMLLSEEIQSEYARSIFHMPVRISSYDESSKKTVEQFNAARKSLAENFPQQDLIKMGFVSDIDEKEIENFKDVIRTAEVCFRTDPAVVMIVREEIQPYFEGQKSIEQVIDIVKNRTKLYLSERTK